MGTLHRVPKLAAMEVNSIFLVKMILSGALWKHNF